MKVPRLLLAAGTFETTPLWHLAMPLFYLIVADIIVFLHGLYVGFVVFGYLLVLLGVVFRWEFVRNPFFRWCQLLAIGIVAVQGALGIPCPLTVTEHILRERAGAPVETATFMARWIRSLIFVDVPQPILNVVYVLFGGLVALTMVLVPPKSFPQGTRFRNWFSGRVK